MSCRWARRSRDTLAHESQGPKSKVQSPRSKVQGPKSKVQNRIRTRALGLWTLIVAALAVLGGISALVLLPALGIAQTGGRWDGPLQLPDGQEALAWPQFGRDSTHSGASAGAGLGSAQGSVARRV